MAGILDQLELDALRADFKTMLGIDETPADSEDITRAKTLVSIRRIVDQGTLNTSTGDYENPTTVVIYSGPAHVSPIVFRRDRQEQGGGQALRIRQYRVVLPWDSGNILIDDEMVVSFSADPEMDGRTWIVSDVMYESELAARRITVTDMTPAGEGNC